MQLHYGWESIHDGCMAGVIQSRRFQLAKMDSWLAVIQWVWDRAYAFIASTAGAAMMGYLARATGWIAHFGPIAWGGIGLGVFVLIYSTLVWGRGRLAAGRLDRASAMIAERAAEHASTNPLKEDFRNERIRLTDLYTPFGAPLQNRTFRRCDLVGPAVLWLSPNTSFTRNRYDNVEFVRVNAHTAQPWPNKLALIGGLVDECYLANVIILVHDEHSKGFEGMFSHPIQWMNDPIRLGEVPKLPSPRDAALEKS